MRGFALRGRGVVRLSAIRRRAFGLDEGGECSRARNGQREESRRATVRPRSNAAERVDARNGPGRGQAAAMSAWPGSLPVSPTDLDLAGRSTATHRAMTLRRALVVIAVASFAFGVILHQGIGGSRRPAVSGVHAGAYHQEGLLSLPAAAQEPVSAALGENIKAYRVSSTAAGGLRAASPAQHLSASFTANGVSVSSGLAHVGLALRGVGYGNRLRAVGPSLPRASANRVSYAPAGGVRAWYANGPLGLEQGFDLASRPRAGRGPLTLSLSLSLTGDMRARLGGGGVIFSGGGVAMRYDGLAVSDARGRRLSAWFALRAGRVLIRVADRGARYPLRIDPFILTASDETGAAEFGFSVALSADGSTALIGGADGAWVFTRSGTTWSQQGAKLTANDEKSGNDFGSSVALSSDGNTALIGGPNDNSGVGATWVFTRSGTTWTQQGAKLTANDEIHCGGGSDCQGAFGSSVALSSDGNTALIGGPVDNGVGATWVFTNSGGTWTQQGSKLTGSDETPGQSYTEGFGSSVALSGDGNTALIGGPGDGSSAHGAAWVFTRSGSTWSQQGSKLTGSDETNYTFFGGSVALSGDGSTALIGGNGENSIVGAAWVFTNSGGTWTQQGSQLTASDETGEGAFGYSVALSADGNTALIGGPSDNSFVGAAWVFTNSDGTWTQQGSKLTGSGETGNGQFGYGVALSAEGSTALIGGPYDNSHVGAAWVFTAGPRQSTTAVRCFRFAPPTLQCTAMVTDTSGKTPLEVPTGTVSFTASAGSFASSSCTLAAVTGGAACSVIYTPPPAGSSTTAITITASYGSDGNFRSSQGTFSLCSDGQLLGLDSVSTDGPHSDGFRIGSQVVLHGCGFKTGMQLTWGAADQTPEQITDPTSVSADGTTATVTVPWGAVTGTITVKNDGNQATLDGQAVDSLRNTLGLSFVNYGGLTTRQEFVDAFVTPMTTGSTYANGQPILLPRYETLYSAHGNPRGFCYGFAYFTGQRATLGSPLVAGVDPYHLDTKSVDQSTIQSDWWKWQSDESQAILKGENYQSAAQVRAALGSDPWNSPSIVSLSWTSTTTYPDGRQVHRAHAHAILGFAVQDTSGSDPPGDFTIYTDNSNDPYTGGEEGSGDAHASALSQSNVAFAADGTWSFPEFDLSGRDLSDVKIQPISQLTGPLHLLQRVGLTGVVGASTSVVSANGPTGTPVNLMPGTADGVTVVPQSDSTNTSPASSNPGVGGISEILGPLGRWRETLADQGGQVSAAWYTPSLAATIQASRGQDAVAFDPGRDTLAVAPATRAAPSSGGTISLISGAAAQTERGLSVTGPVARSHATIKLTKTHAILATTRRGVFDIVLSTEGRSTPGQTFKSGPITLTAGQKLTLAPASWPNLQGTRVAAAFTGAGHHHTVRLRNHLHATSARVVAAKLHGTTLLVTLATGRVDLQTSAIQLTVAVRHRGRTILTKSVPFLLAKATGHTIRIPLVKAIPAGASARITVQTRTGGITPTTATTSRTIKLHG